MIAFVCVKCIKSDRTGKTVNISNGNTFEQTLYLFKLKRFKL